MDDFRSLVHDPEHRAGFEKILRLAASRGDADLVDERLSWGIDPNGSSSKGRTALIANIRSDSPSVAIVKSLLKAGADPNQTNLAGLNALDYAQRKLMKLSGRPRKPHVKSPSLDENDQLQLCAEEQAHLDEMRKRLGPEDAREFIRMYWKERLRAAKRVFNDVDQVEEIVRILEAVTKPT